MKTFHFDDSWVLAPLAGAENPPQAAALDAGIPIAIPGDIASALLGAGLVPDPYYGRNELDTLWIGRTDWSLKHDFHLRQDDVEVRSGTGNLRSILDFGSGIDTVAEVYMNGRPVGQSRNMFRRLRLDVSDALVPGTNNLEVIIRSPENFTDSAARELPYPVPHSDGLPWQWKHRNLLRKAACHGGWDWGITLMTGGIYEAPVLSLGCTGHVEYLDTQTHRKPETDTWLLNISLEYTNFAETAMSLEYEFDGHGERRDFPLVPGMNRLEHVFEVESPELWWPAGEGRQHLYDLSVRTPYESVHRKIGFRTLEIVSEDDARGRSLSVRVNGRDIFAKGANWIPPDAFPSRQTPKRYRRLLEDAVAANMNTIRLWGGGQYEREIFYTLCDELGLMIWHDMMFACSLYPAEAEFLADVEAEVRHQIRRLKHHSCIVLWCGNNENLGALNWFAESKKNRDRYLIDYDRLNEGTVGRVVRELDPQRTWWPSSPSAGPGDYSDCWHDDTRGDMHYWSVWHEDLPFESYYHVVPRFCSEFGFQSFPGLGTLAKWIPPNQWNISAPAMRHHQKDSAGNSRILSTMARYFRIPESFADILYLSQVQQAWAIRTAVDFWRANRPLCMGALYWQLNDLWPVASWSSLGYGGEWKLLHYEARRFFAPLRVVLYVQDDHFHGVCINDSQRTLRGSLIIRLMCFDGRLLEEKRLDGSVCPPASATVLVRTALDELASSGGGEWAGGSSPRDRGRADVVDERFTDRFVYAEWRSDDGSEAVCEEGSLLLTRPRDCNFAAAEVSVGPGSSEDSIVLESDVPAFYVQAEYSEEGRFDDAGFTLLPGRPVEIAWVPGEGAKGAVTLSRVTVRHLRATYT